MSFSCSITCNAMQNNNPIITPINLKLIVQFLLSLCHKGFASPLVFWNISGGAVLHYTERYL